ncbi:cysteine desulfurase NifS [Candidatus Shapirobacteria bacterium CG06_land_8_20_14_3_00_40_12]|uniref:cysteine desulfurase n=2 Tax=Candidatus Shapironibacteriota TaxID=1752721 RepID=A0A2M7TTM5_9BACT|nr:MAG: cysteine desulfurase NifS [Candidatus Shapirobacteria bacterium CG06_land_8_20_14_3_00_40_12]PIZ60135.1 MAG: cysteine desulfurase NifS [Candidatus Shapirobacteria bacterium CG_4_10_14_0_2_um_filter_40_12]
MKKRLVYLDYAATTPVDPRVIAAMEPYWGKFVGNTMSLHSQGMRASAAVEKVREIIARSIGAETEEIVFTGNATESNNLALKGVAEANPLKKKILISSIEHDCVVESAKWLAGKGYEIKEIPVNRDGLIDFEWLGRELTEEVLLVSVIHGNNEVGTIQDIGRIGSLCRAKGVLFHTDASQSFGKVLIDVKEMEIDLLTASSHKIYGPKGVAILYIRNGVAINPILHGGGHEGGVRSSTVNVPAIVGMGKAVEVCQNIRISEGQNIRKLRDKLIKGILDKVEDCWLNGDAKNRLPNNVNISFARVEGEGLLLELDVRGIEVSTGSACSSRSLEPSHVLLAMGLTAPEAHGSIRFSLGRWTTEAEINYVLRVVPEVVAKLRKMSPFKK